jgi:hypothetical protein
MTLAEAPLMGPEARSFDFFMVSAAPEAPE